MRWHFSSTFALVHFNCTTCIDWISFVWITNFLNKQKNIYRKIID